MCVQCCNTLLDARWTAVPALSTLSAAAAAKASNGMIVKVVIIGRHRPRIACPQFLRGENCTPVAQLGVPSFGLLFFCKHLAANLIAQSAAAALHSHFAKVFNYGTQKFQLPLLDYLQYVGTAGHRSESNLRGS